MDPIGRDHHQPVRLVQIARQLRQKLVGRDTDRGRELRLVLDPLTHRVCDRDPIAEQPGRAGHIDERLIDRDRLHKRAERSQDLEDLRRDFSVAGPVRLHDHRIGAEPESDRRRLGAPAPERPRLVARRGDHAPLAPPAHEDRPAPQLGVVELLDGRKEGVHIDVQDCAQRGHRPMIGKNLGSTYGMIRDRRGFSSTRTRRPGTLSPSAEV